MPVLEIGSPAHRLAHDNPSCTQAVRTGKMCARCKGAAAASAASATPLPAAPATDPLWSGRSVSAEEVGQCEDTTSRGKRCKLAVVLPETSCYLHGGSVDASLGSLSFARASAMALRGEARLAGPGFFALSSAAQAEAKPVPGLVAPGASTPTGDSLAHHTGRVVSAEEVSQCAGEVKSMSTSSSAMVPCKIAVVAPATHCVKHDGPAEPSLGLMTIARAQARLARGELRLVDASYWVEDLDARRSFVTSKFSSLLSSDASSILSAFAAAGAFDAAYTTDRFSARNSAMLMMNLYAHASDLGLEGHDLSDYVGERLASPMLTESSWKTYGRTPVEDVRAGIVVAQVSAHEAKRRKGESVEDFKKRLAAEIASASAKQGRPLSDAEAEERAAAEASKTILRPYLEIPLVETEEDSDPDAIWIPAGSDHASTLALVKEEKKHHPGKKVYARMVRPENPLTAPLEPGSGDPAAFMSAVERYCAEEDISFVRTKGIAPGTAAAYAPSTKTLYLVPTGSDLGDATSCAHELAHAILGHKPHPFGGSSDPGQEMEAESLAFMICESAGISTPQSRETSAAYVQHYAAGVSGFSLAERLGRVSQGFFRLNARLSALRD